MAPKTCRDGNHAIVKGKSYTKVEYINEQERLKKEGITDPAFKNPFDRLPDCNLGLEYPEPEPTPEHSDDDPSPGM